MRVVVWNCNMGLAKKWTYHLAATLLEFYPAAARTWIIAALFRFRAPERF